MSTQVSPLGPLNSIGVLMQHDPNYSFNKIHEHKRKLDSSHLTWISIWIDLKTTDQRNKRQAANSHNASLVTWERCWLSRESSGSLDGEDVERCRLGKRQREARREKEKKVLMAMVSYLREISARLCSGFSDGRRGERDLFIRKGRGNLGLTLTDHNLTCFPLNPRIFFFFVMGFEMLQFSLC